MFGLNIKTNQNGSESVTSPVSFGSPIFNFSRKRQSSLGSISVNSPSSVGSPTNSPKIDGTEIDTRAPFESVKAAVSLFREAGAPKSTPVIKKATVEERVLEKETQHHMILSELDYYKDQRTSAEKIKSRALQDLQKANRTLQQLTDKLETLQESKQTAFKEIEVAKTRAIELEEQMSVKMQLGSDGWKLYVDPEKERYKACAGEINVSKQELTNLRQDLDAVLEAKLVAFQEAEEAEQNVKVNQERQSQLFKQVTDLRGTLGQAKLVSLQTEEEYLKFVAEKEALFLNYKAAKEEAKKKINYLKQDYQPAEILKEKLEETTEAIKILQEQLNGVRASDLHLLQVILSELDIAKKKLLEVILEENSIQSSANSVKLQLEEVKRERLELETKALEAESIVEQMQADLEKKKSEIEAAAISGSAFEEMQSSIQKVLEEVENARYGVVVVNKKTDSIIQEAEVARTVTEVAEEKLHIALKQVETAKAAEKLADDQIHDSPKIDPGDLKSSLSNSIRKIRLSDDEFELLNKKIEELQIEADVKVATVLEQVKNLNASEQEVLLKFEIIMKENEIIQSDIEDALKSAEMADDVKKVVQSELEKWRQKEESEFGEASYISEARY